MGLPKGKRLALKLQLVSWFLYSDSIGGHIGNYNRFVDIEGDDIVIKPFELSEFYREKYIEGKLNNWANSVVSFLAPRLDKLVFELEDMTLFFNIRIDYKKEAICKTIMLKGGC